MQIAGRTATGGSRPESITVDDAPPWQTKARLNGEACSWHSRQLAYRAPALSDHFAFQVSCGCTREERFGRDAARTCHVARSISERSSSVSIDVVPSTQSH